jgi:hypothetical protein
MIFHSPLLNILINLISVGKYNFFNWGTFVPQGTVYGVFLMGTVPGLKLLKCFLGKTGIYIFKIDTTIKIEVINT